MSNEHLDKKVDCLAEWQYLLTAPVLPGSKQRFARSIV